MTLPLPPFTRKQPPSTGLIVIGSYNRRSLSAEDGGGFIWRTAFCKLRGTLLHRYPGKGLPMSAELPPR